MVYSLFTNTKDHIKIRKIAFKYGKGIKPDEKLEKAIIEDIEETEMKKLGDKVYDV